MSKRQLRFVNEKKKLSTTIKKLLGMEIKPMRKITLILLITIILVIQYATADNQNPIFCGGVSGCSDLAVADNSDDYRTDGGHIFIHSVGWTSHTTEAEKNAIIDLWQNHEWGIEMGFSDNNYTARQNAYVSRYLSRGIQAKFITVNAYSSSRILDVDDWIQERQAYYNKGVDASTAIYATFEYQNMADYYTTLQYNLVSDRTDFQQVIETSNGMVLDIPPTVYFKRINNTNANIRKYHDWIIDAIQWAKDRDHTVGIIVSPNSGGYDYDDDTEAFIQILREEEALPDFFVVENYSTEDPSTYENEVGNEDTPYHQLGCARLMQTEWFTTPDKLIAHWKMDEGTGITLTDSSGYEHTGTLFGGEFVDSLVEHDQGLLLDGVDDYVEIDGYQGVSGTASRTCAAWIKTTDAAGEIVTWGNKDDGGKWIVRLNETGSLRVEVQGGYIYGTTAIHDGLWHHVAAVLDSDDTPDVSEVQLYVDGQLDTIAATADEPINTSSDQNVAIGVFPLVSTRFFTGQMDDVRIYNYALTSDEIQELAYIAPPSIDIVEDYVIDLADVSALAAYWLAADCYSNDLCDGRDLNADQIVNQNDFALLASSWQSEMDRPAGIIGMDFADSGNVTTMDSTEQAGAPNFEQTHWNSMAGETGSLNNLVDALGNSTSLSMAWTAHSTYRIDEVSDTAGNNRMMRGYLDTNDSSTTQVTLADIPYAKYALVIYMDGSNDTVRRNGQYTLVDPANGSIIAGPYYNQDASGSQFDGTFTQSTLSTVDNATTPAGNYMVINGLTAATLRLDVTGGSNTDDHPRGPVNAIQIIDQSALQNTPWTSADIGDVGAAGSTVDDGDTITIEGSGADIWKTADEFHYYYTNFSGDGEIITRVASQTNTNTWAKAGVMIRETLDSGARHASMVVTPGQGSSFQRRITTDDLSYSTTPGNGVAAPAWVKVVRSGNTFTGYSSIDGMTWTQIGTDTVSMDTDVYVGLCVTSHSDGDITTAVFSNIEITN